MQVTIAVLDDPDTARHEAALDLIALALARALSAPGVATEANVSVYADVPSPAPRKTR